MASTSPLHSGAPESLAPVEERLLLVAALRERGVDYLAPSGAASSRALDDPALILSLARSGDSRLRQALIVLFLLHPRMGAVVPGLRDRLDGSSRLDLEAFYCAAVYLQRLWRIRLERDLGDLPELPDHFSRELGLPPPTRGHGKPGLHALAAWHAERSPYRMNRLAEYEKAAEHLLHILKRRYSRDEPETRG
jgi:hypothetical protein